MQLLTRLPCQLSVCLFVQHNAAELQVHVAGSSIAMLQGQRPPFCLLARAISAYDGHRLVSIKPAVSDAFVVSLQPLGLGWLMLFP